MTRSAALAPLVAFVAAIILPLCAAGSPYSEAVTQIGRISDSPYVRPLTCGKSAMGRKIPGFVISDFSTDCEAKARVFICAGQHGNEQASVRSVLSLCEELASGMHKAVLARCVLVVVPVVNPDGMAQAQRLNADGIDINRDWLALSTKEARHVDGIIEQWKPQVLIDAHEWTEPSHQAGDEVEVPVCALRTQRSAMAALAVEIRQSSGLAISPCSPASDKSLFHRRYAILGYASYLLETGVRTSYDAKRQAYCSAIIAAANVAANDASSRLALSPAAARLDPASLRANLDALEPLPVSAPAPATFGLGAVLITGYFLLAWLSKLSARRERTTWSRRFRKCLVDADVAAAALSPRRQLPPVTARSWINRRLRTRYARRDGTGRYSGFAPSP